jgi:hypothetical protein
MKQIKVSEAKGAALDWLVAKCEGLDMYIPAFAETPWVSIRSETGVYLVAFSTDWAQGGPLIEREGISICYDVELAETEGRQYWATMYAVDSGEGRTYGPTPLIAAMRCYVVSKLDGLVEVPEALAANRHNFGE